MLKYKIPQIVTLTPQIVTLTHPNSGLTQENTRKDHQKRWPSL